MPSAGIHFQTMICAVYPRSHRARAYLRGCNDDNQEEDANETSSPETIAISLTDCGDDRFRHRIGCAHSSEAAEIKVLTSRAMNHVLTELGGTFERSSGHKVTPVLAVPTEIAKRVVNGEIVDVVMSGVTVDNLVKQDQIAPGDRIILARVGIGVAVRAGAPKPDISSPEALKRTLLAAKSIVYTDPAIGGASGIQFEKVIDRLGLPKRSKPNRS